MKSYFSNLCRLTVVLALVATTSSLWASPFAETNINYESISSVDLNADNSLYESFGGQVSAVATAPQKDGKLNNLQVYLTDPANNILLVKQPAPAVNHKPNLSSVIWVNRNQKHQLMDGFGFALTGGSAYLLSKMSEADRHQVLLKFFDSNNGIGASMVRVSIGASDLSQKCFTYDEKLIGKDLELAKFNIWAGDKEVIPILKEILRINPQIKVLATPWSAPKWMKTKRFYGGGNLKPEYYQVYANYFVKYLQSMKDNGIIVSAISTQNEPECGTNKPSMEMDASSQATFIGKYLGPTLEKNGFGNVEIFCWDHNCDKKDYALKVLSDSDASKYVSGSAWHLYAGDISTLSEVYKEQPNKKLWLTEQWTGRDGDFAGDFKWHLKNVVLGTINNHGNAAFEWNLASDQNCDPHTVGGCPDCKGAITINKKTKKVDSYNQAYYIIGQISKFVKANSVKIASESNNNDLVHAAFETPEGKVVLVVLNNGSNEIEFSIDYNKDAVNTKLNSGAAATYVW